MNIPKFVHTYIHTYLHIHTFIHTNTFIYFIHLYTTINNFLTSTEKQNSFVLCNLITFDNRSLNYFKGTNYYSYICRSDNENLKKFLRILIDKF